MFGEVCFVYPWHSLGRCRELGFPTSMSSIIFGHGSLPVGLFPIWAPRHQVVSPSLRMWIDSGNMNSFWLFRDQFVFTSFLYLSEPTGITTVLSLLNFALDARHHLSRILNRVSGLSFFERKTVALSAKRASMALWWLSGVLMLRPRSLSVVLRIWDIGSIARLNRRQDSGSPWQTPLVTWNFLLISPFRITIVSALEYRDFMVFTRFCGMFICSMTLHR